MLQLLQVFNGLSGREEGEKHLSEEEASMQQPPPSDKPTGNMLVIQGGACHTCQLTQKEKEGQHLKTRTYTEWTISIHKYR